MATVAIVAANIGADVCDRERQRAGPQLDRHVHGHRLGVFKFTSTFTFTCLGWGRWGSSQPKADS